jgi:hypothetical protein
LRSRSLLLLFKKVIVNLIKLKNIQYGSAAGEEEVVTDINIDTLDPVLQLRKLAGV